MDALRQHDLEGSRAASPSEKLAQAIELMETGLRLKRDALRKALVGASEEEVQAALEAWLFQDGGSQRR